MRILNPFKKTVVASHVEIADTAVSRLVGLLNRDSLPDQSALIITQCRSIHMFFMRFTIDVIFVDKNDRVVGIVERIKPFRMSPYFLWANRAIELPEGAIAASRTTVGDLLVFEKP